MSSAKTDVWWYRTLGTEFGPVEKSTLEKLIADGTLAADDWVRRGEAGPWRRLGQVAELMAKANSAETGVPRHPEPDGSGSPCRPEVGGSHPPHDPDASPSGSPGQAEPDRTGSSDESPPSVELRRTLAEAYVYVRQRHGGGERAKARPSRRRRSWSLGPAFGAMVRFVGRSLAVWADATGTVIGWVSGPIGRVVRSPVLWGIVVLGAAIWAGLWWQQYRYSETAVFAELQQIAQGLRALRERDADEGTWKQFQEDAAARLERIRAKLHRHARVEDRVSLNLLWAARDYLPAMLADARKAPSESERLFEKRMAHVEHIWRYERPPTASLWERLAPDDWLVTGLLIFDGLVLTAGALWWWRHRRRWAKVNG